MTVAEESTVSNEITDQLDEKCRKQQIIIVGAALVVVLCCLCLSCFTLVSRRSRRLTPTPGAPVQTVTPELGALQVLPTVTPFVAVVEPPTPTVALGGIATPVIPTVPPASPTAPLVGSPPELLCPYHLEDAAYTDLQNLLYGGTVERMSPGCSIRVTVLQHTIDELVPELTASMQQAGYQDLRVTLGEGQILVTGKTQQAFLTVPIEGGIRPRAQDCRLTFEITYLKIGGVDAPQWARDEVTNLVCERMSCTWESPQVCFNSVEVTTGALTVTATKR